MGWCYPKWCILVPKSVHIRTFWKGTAPAPVLYAFFSESLEPMTNHKPNNTFKKVTKNVRLIVLSQINSIFQWNCWRVLSNHNPQISKCHLSWLNLQSPQISSGLHTKVTAVIRIVWKNKSSHARVIGVSFFHFLPVVDVISLTQL